MTFSNFVNFVKELPPRDVAEVVGDVGDVVSGRREVASGKRSLQSITKRRHKSRKVDN